MQHTSWLRRAGWLGAVGIAVLSTNFSRADDDQPADEKSPPAKEEKEETVTKEFRQFVRRPREAKYWLQMQVVAVPPAINEKADLKGEGVLVTHVKPDGPADKGGIKDNDILLSFGDKPIKDLMDVVGVLNESDGKELSIKLLRDGKPMTVAVTPVERSTKRETDFLPPGAHPFGDVDVRDMEKAIREKLKQAGVDLRMQLIQPGKIFPPGALRDWNISNYQFPDDLTVNLHKEGKKPADIEIKRGDKTWNAKEDDLSTLPKDVRVPVEMLLGKGPHAIMLKLANGGITPPPPVAPHSPGSPHVEGPGLDGPDRGPGDRPGRPEGPRGRRPPRPDGPDREDGDRRPPRPDDGADHGPGDRRPRGDGPDGADRRPPGPPHAEGGPHDGPGDQPARPRGAGRGPGRPEGPGSADRAEQRLERRLEEMNRRMQEIHRELEGLRRNLHDRDRQGIFDDESF